MLEIIKTDKAPKAIGPYSQAIRCGQFVFASGQIPIDPANGNIVGSTIEEQTRRAIANLGAVLCAADSSLAHVVKTTCFLADMKDFSAFNAVYEELFPGKPARSCVAVAALPKQVLVEIEAVAMVDWN